jgi:hypothetical protein
MLAMMEGVNDDQSAGHTSIRFSTYGGSWNTDMLILGSNGNATFSGGVTIEGSDNTKSTLKLTNTATTPDNSWSLVPQYNNQNLFLLEDSTVRVGFTSGGSVGVGQGFNNTNAENWGFISKPTSGGTCSSGGGAGYFALGDDYSTNDAILMVRNDGNRGARGHASGSDLFKCSFNDGDAFIVDEDGYIGAGSTGVYNAFADVQMSGKGLSIKNDKNGSSNNWSYIQNDGTGSESTIIFTTGAQATAFKLNHDGSAVFTDNITTSGALSKGSGSFKIDHPLEAKRETHDLVHSFIEGPQADLIYSGKVDLVDGKAEINIDKAAGMTEGTFVLLNTNIRCFTTNESNWDLIKGGVSGNKLTIESKNTSSTATISWMVVGERHDQHMKDTTWTDSEGKVIVEPKKL